MIYLLIDELDELNVFKGLSYELEELANSLMEKSGTELNFEDFWDEYNLTLFYYRLDKINLVDKKIEYLNHELQLA